MFQAISVHATVGQVLCQDVLGPSTAIPTFDQDLSDWTRALLTLLIGFAMWHRQDAPGAGQRLPASPAEPQAAAGAAPQNCVAANICKHGAKTPDLTSPPTGLATSSECHAREAGRARIRVRRGGLADRCPNSARVESLQAVG